MKNDHNLKSSHPGKVDQELGYSRFGLAANPFPMSAITMGIHSTPLPMYMPEGVKIVNDFIFRTYEEREFAILLIAGDYGFGKTYALRWIEKEINGRYSQRNSVAACAIYLENPLTSPRELIASMISHFGTNKFLTMIWLIVARSFRKDYEKEGNSFLIRFKSEEKGLFDKDLIVELLNEELIENPMIWMRTLLDTSYKAKLINLDEFSQYCYDVLQDVFGSNNFTKDLCSFQPKDGFFDHVSKWSDLVEQKLSQRKSYGIPDERALLNNILEVFRRNGFIRVYLLIDEFEDIGYYLKPELLTKYLRILRDAIDNAQEKISLVIALKPQAVNAIQNAYPGFFERISHYYRLDLEGIMQEAVEKFIVGYLQTERSPKFARPDIFPFTQDGIHEIYLHARPNPRIILQTCSELLYLAVTNRDCEVIDAAFVKKFYSFARSRIWSRDVSITRAVEKRIDEE